ncbi:unnamed protein product, partial [Coregonus sp. 'balchen']
MLVFYAEFVVLFVMLLPSKNLTYSLVNGTVFNTLAFLALASHFRAMCTDPGAVPKGNATKEYIESLQLKPGQVVYKCPKCCSIKPDRAHHCSSFSPPATVILLILLCFEALLFLLFTSVMFGTQVHSICTDETGIERLKGGAGRWAERLMLGGHECKRDPNAHVVCKQGKIIEEEFIEIPLV